MYMIELDKWKIKEGLPSKPYKNEDYTQADLNIQGINNALQYAKSNGHSIVLLPKGQYALCYPREIKMVSNLTFDLNGSTLKVIYDSDQKSPFDTRTTNEYYKFSGRSISFDNVTNSHLTSGIIIGCKEDRSFLNSNEERKVENTYGVIFEKSTNNSTISHCVIRDYMGDNISISSTSMRALAEFNLGLTLNSLDYNTGLPITSTNTLISNFITIPTGSNFNSFLISGSGYTRLTNLNKREVDVFFYTSNNNFIGVLKKQKIYSLISIPKNASKIRFLFSNESNPQKNLQLQLQFGLFPYNNIIEHNEIIGGHRGGITLGGSYNVVQHNTIRDNGKGANSFMDGKPIFFSTTRYSINQEDSYGDNCVIRNNFIYGSTNGILVGCYTTHIENNHIYNMDSAGIILYSLMYAKVTGNTLYNCNSPLGLMNSNFESSYVTLNDNYIYGGTIWLENNNSYYLNIKDNMFFDVININLGNNQENHIFLNNRLNYSKIIKPTLIASRIEGCIIQSQVLQEIAIKTNVMSNCKISNLQFNFRNWDLSSNGYVIIDNCSYINSVLNNHIYLTKSREILIKNSSFTDTIIKNGNINTPSSSSKTNIEDSKFIINNINHIFATDFNVPEGEITLKNSEITINNTNFTYLIKNEKSVEDTFEFRLFNTKIFNSSQNLINLKYYNTVLPIKKIFSSENIYIYVSLSIQDPDVIFEYNPSSTFLININLQPDGNIFSSIINHDLDTLYPMVQCFTIDMELVILNVIILDRNTIKIFSNNSYAAPLKVIVKKI
ncbi:right-handed parallel beta-helix repeat-containing protein [Robertmurraya sp.]|uniref:right-handed parallel beta-helix repeat-containing protein n=1 Tax=Robertmurraya sp. TaxID=2837525 RepID=UPI003703B764